MLGLMVGRCAAVPLQMLSQVFVGALAGPAGLGVLQLFTSWTCLAGEVLTQGHPARAMRSAATAGHNSSMVPITDELRTGQRAIVRLWFPFALTIGLLALLVNAVPFAGAAPAIVIGVVMAAPAFALQRLWSETLKGADRALAAVSLENATLSMVLLTACAGLWLSDRSPSQAQALLPLVGVVGFVLTAALLRSTLLNQFAGGSQLAAKESSATLPPHDDRVALWGCSILSLAFLQMPFLILPWFTTVSEIGIYAVAFRLVSLITMLLLLQAAVFGPAFARAASRRDAPCLRRLLTRTQLLSSAVFLPAMAALLWLAERLAGLFSLPAPSLKHYLIILAAGHLVNAVTGLSGVMLNMAGKARLELITLLAAVLIAVAASPLVGAQHGAVGLAWLFSACLAGKNAASLIAAHVFLKQLESPREDT